MYWQNPVSSLLNVLYIRLIQTYRNVDKVRRWNTHTIKWDKKWDKPGFWFWDWVASCHCQLRSTRLVKIGEYKCSKNVLKHRYRTTLKLHRYLITILLPILGCLQQKEQNRRFDWNQLPRLHLSLRVLEYLTSKPMNMFLDSVQLIIFTIFTIFKIAPCFEKNLEFYKCFDQVFD